MCVVLFVAPSCDMLLHLSGGVVLWKRTKGGGAQESAVVEHPHTH